MVGPLVIRREDDVIQSTGFLPYLNHNYQGLILRQAQEYDKNGAGYYSTVKAGI